MSMSLRCEAGGEETCTVSCARARAGRGECPPIGGKPARPPAEHVCQVGQPACGLPGTYVIAVAGLSARAESEPLPIGGYLHLCDYHSGHPAELWS